MHKRKQQQKTCQDGIPLPPKTSKRFSTIVAVWPHLGGGNVPEIDSSIHSRDTVEGNIPWKKIIRHLLYNNNMEEMAEPKTRCYLCLRHTHLTATFYHPSHHTCIHLKCCCSFEIITIFNYRRKGVTAQTMCSAPTFVERKVASLKQWSYKLQILNHTINVMGRRIPSLKRLTHL